MARVIVESDVDSMVFNDGSLDEVGVFRILPDGLKGLGAVPPREKAIPRPQQDGDYAPSRLTSGGRTITISAEALGLSTLDSAQLEDRICDLMNREIKVTVENAHGRRYFHGRLGDDPSPSMYMGERLFTFTLIITVDDPLKYGDPVAFTASNGLLIVENTGRAASYPRVHVDGNVTRLTLALGIRTVKWSGNSTGLDLDFSDMLPSAGIATGQAFKIPPGRSTINVSSDGTVSMTVIPAWR